MSLARDTPAKRHEAPPVLGPLDFDGRENHLVLIEHEADRDLKELNQCFGEKLILIFTGELNGIPAIEHESCVRVNSIAKATKMIRSLTTQEVPIDYFIIDRIDLMDLTLDKLNRASQVKAFVAMLCTPRNLKGCNVIITSAKEEYNLRGIAHQFFNLRTK